MLTTYLESDSFRVFILCWHELTMKLRCRVWPALERVTVSWSHLLRDVVFWNAGRIRYKAREWSGSRVSIYCIDIHAIFDNHCVKWKKIKVNLQLILIKILCVKQLSFFYFYLKTLLRGAMQDWMWDVWHPLPSPRQNAKDPRLAGPCYSTDIVEGILEFGRAILSYTPLYHP